MNVTIIGAGFVGLPLAVFLQGGALRTATWVHLIEANPERFAKLQKGIDYTGEVGNEKLLSALASDRLTLGSALLDHDVDKSDIIVIAVGTPAEDPFSAIEDVRGQIAAALVRNLERENPLGIVMKSTVWPGTGEGFVEFLESILGSRGGLNEFGYLSAPEFLREGTALHDLINPKRQRIYGICERDRGDCTLRLWDALIRATCSAYGSVTGGTMAARTLQITEAELVKLSSNAALAVRVQTANEIARVARAFGCDGHRVVSAVSQDPRIGEDYFSPGPGFGGPCLPKDIGILTEAAQAVGYYPAMLETVANENETVMLEERLAICRLASTGRRVVIFGMGFKPGALDARGSFASELYAQLLPFQESAGTEIVALDSNQPYPLIEAIGDDRVDIVVLNAPPRGPFSKESLVPSQRNAFEIDLRDALNRRHRPLWVFDLRGEYRKSFHRRISPGVPSCVVYYRSPGISQGAPSPEVNDG